MTKNLLIIIILAILLTSLGGANMKIGEENRNNSSLISRDLLFAIRTALLPESAQTAQSSASLPRKTEFSMFGWDLRIRQRRLSCNQ